MRYDLSAALPLSSNDRHSAGYAASPEAAVWPMNERQIQGRENRAVDVCNWVVATSAGVDQNMSFGDRASNGSFRQNQPWPSTKRFGSGAATSVVPEARAQS